jgi:hypothetical protein
MMRRRRLRKIIFSFPSPFMVFLFGVVFAFIGRDSALCSPGHERHGGILCDALVRHLSLCVGLLCICF